MTKDLKNQNSPAGESDTSAELGLLKNYLNERIEDANNNLKTAMKANNEMEFALFAIEKKTLREVLALVEKIKR